MLANSPIVSPMTITQYTDPLLKHGMQKLNWFLLCIANVTPGSNSNNILNFRTIKSR